MVVWLKSSLVVLLFMANPQKDLQEEEINKKKQEALANIELELKFKKYVFYENMFYFLF